MAVNMWPVHGTCFVTELRRCYDEICTLLNTFSLWEWSGKWKRSSLITSSSLKYPFTVKIFVRFELSNFVHIGHHARIPNLKNLKHVIENLHVANFHWLINQIPSCYSFWFILYSVYKESEVLLKSLTRYLSQSWVTSYQDVYCFIKYRAYSKLWIWCYLFKILIQAQLIMLFMHMSCLYC